ncbi:MAG: hypothetical protein RL266_2656 [Bacteroidota bacterium]|jgi:cytochrome c peroxidase
MKPRATIYLVAAVLSLAMQKGLEWIEWPNWFPAPAYDFDSNPLSSEKMELGRMLFYDPILSADSSVSCATCHSPYNAFAHADHALSHGIHDSIGKRNAPALFNLAWGSSFMWDGAIHHLDFQPLAPISSPIEMNSDINEVVARLENSPIYAHRFQKAFETKEITGEQVLKVLAQFQVSLISANAKYDQVVRGEKQFSPQEAKGYSLFLKHCNQCHTEPLFTNHRFEFNGLPVNSMLQDQGRYTISKMVGDQGKFKVPSLRNLDYSYPYMHDGRFKRLSEVLEHYSQAKILPSIQLTMNEKKDLMSFLMALNDSTFIFQSNNKYPHQLYKITTQ